MSISVNQKVVMGMAAATLVAIMVVLIARYITTRGPSGRYVYIERVASAAPAENYINLDGVQVLDASGESLLASASVTSGAALPVAPASNLIDAASGTIAHTSLAVGNDFANQWYKIDLGSDKRIAKVVVTNRKDCCKDRAVGLQVRVTNSKGETIYTGPKVTAAQDVYTYTL